jgi:selenide,water dikinase
VDFFTPIVDDPYGFGQIAAANALSDVYAMGGEPKTAMNLVCFPAKSMDLAVLRKIIRGGIDKLREAEVVLIGGHSVEDNELKYGLAVTGFAHPQRIMTKGNLQAGDRLILTKPLGTGIINTAIKAGMASAELTEQVTQLMAALNRTAARVMAAHDVHACTDITGFGLIGHLAEMVNGSSVGAAVDTRGLPILPEALDFAAMGLIPAGAYKNREFRAGMVRTAAKVERSVEDLLYDPQTSGGLLIAVDGGAAETLLADLHGNGVADAVIIGRVQSEPRHTIVVE